MVPEVAGSHDPLTSFWISCSLISVSLHATHLDTQKSEFFADRAFAGVGRCSGTFGPRKKPVVFAMSRPRPPHQSVTAGAFGDHAKTPAKPPARCHLHYGLAPALLHTENISKRQLQLLEHPVQLPERDTLLALFQSEQRGRR